MATPMANKYPTIGQRIRQARHEVGMAQRELAGDSYSRSYISQLERSIVVPSLDSLITISHRLGKPAAWFFLAHDEQKGFRFIHKQEEVRLMDAVRKLDKGIIGWVVRVLGHLSRTRGAECLGHQQFISKYLTLNPQQRAQINQALQRIEAGDDPVATSADTKGPLRTHGAARRQHSNTSPTTA